MTKRSDVRVFISSTFRDMNAEREGLVKRVFPELRQRFANRGIRLTDVDLRWGITQEQSERGEALATCLDEIERCRPYFIVMLGQRYGWVPDAITPVITASQPWLADFADRSVTELEVVHGILKDPRQADRAFFYFRDPAFVETVDVAHRADYESESAESGAKLEQLKERIRRTGLPVRENYPDPQALFEAVRD
ncbi:MAG: DUF4062 domain-containing protein, partial [Verrucomicrobiaceae bacterium]|nr:DUF4062 domain-containing protein [Verrucomicrobiaceae bacterium]